MQTPPPVTGVARVSGSFRLIATRRIETGQRILSLSGVIRDQASRHTVQVGPHAHLDMPPRVRLDDALDRYSWRFLNHSCDPNAALTALELFAVRPIRSWAEVTFDYATTEFEMAEPFDCRCNSRHCVGRVRGYRYLDDSRRRAIHARVAAHVLELAAAHPMPSSTGLEPDSTRRQSRRAVRTSS